MASRWQGEDGPRGMAEAGVDTSEGLVREQGTSAAACSRRSRTSGAGIDPAAHRPRRIRCVCSIRAPPAATTTLLASVAAGDVLATAGARVRRARHRPCGGRVRRDQAHQPVRRRAASDRVLPDRAARRRHRARAVPLPHRGSRTGTGHARDRTTAAGRQPARSRSAMPRRARGAPTNCVRSRGSRSPGRTGSPMRRCCACWRRASPATSGSTATTPRPIGWRSSMSATCRRHCSCARRRRGWAPFITAAINEVDIERAFGLTGYVDGPLAVCGFGARAEAMTTSELDPNRKVWPRKADDRSVHRRRSGARPRPRTSTRPAPRLSSFRLRTTSTALPSASRSPICACSSKRSSNRCAAVACGEARRDAAGRRTSPIRPAARRRAG